MKESWNEGLERRLKNAEMIVEGPLTHPFEALHMGNGDIGANVNLYPHELKITLSKMDVWDMRYDGRPEETVLTHDKLIEMMREKNRDLIDYMGDPKDQEKGDFLMESLAYGSGVFRSGPAPKRAGAIRIYHPGLSNTKVSGALDIGSGILTVRFQFAEGEIIIRSFVQKTDNLVWLEIETEGEAPWIGIIVEKEPDDTDASLPKPVVGNAGNDIGVISQTIPEGFGVDEFTWNIAGMFPQGDESGLLDTFAVEPHAYRLRQFCQVKPGKKAYVCATVTTTREDGGDPFDRAVDKLKTAVGKYEKCLEDHREAWREFWTRSSVHVDDKELEATWFRNQFAYGCSLSTETIPPGSCANLTIQDSVPWHGDCHMNHNFQKWFVTALPTNHAEWIEIYADFIEEKMPVFEYQAKLIFGLEGVYCDLNYLPVSVKKHCHISNFHGRALALTGWLCQPLWWHWEYMRDREWLRRRGYPYIKKAAEFYWNYLEKYQDESGQIYPSIRIEEPGWKKDFIGNRNVLSDLVMFRKTFECAVAASELLDVDEEWRRKWKEGARRVPEVEYGWDDGEAWVALDADWKRYEAGKRADLCRSSRWAGGGWAVFPGEYIEGDGEDGLTMAYRDIMSRIDLLNPFYSSTYDKNMYPGTPIIHPISSVLPAIRLGLKDKYESVRQVILRHRLTYGQASSYMLSDGNVPEALKGFYGYLWYDWRAVENKYLGVIALTEMLLQTQGNVIRLFPCWPEGHSASFSGLLARGGFRVSASVDTDGLISAEVESRAGLPCVIRTDKTMSVVSKAEGTEIPVKRAGRDQVFDTQTGGVYTVVIGK